MSKIGASNPQHYYRCHCGDHRPEPGRTNCHCPHGLRGADYDGVIAAFRVDKHSRLAASMMIVIAQATSIWNVGIQTSAAQNLLSLSVLSIKLSAPGILSAGF